MIKHLLFVLFLPSEKAGRLLSRFKTLLYL